MDLGSALPRMSAPVVGSPMAMRRFLAITVQMTRISRTLVFAVAVTQKLMMTTMAHQRASMDVLTTAGKLPRGSADAALQISTRMKTAWLIVMTSALKTPIN